MLVFWVVRSDPDPEVEEWRSTVLFINPEELLATRCSLEPDPAACFASHQGSFYRLLLLSACANRHKLRVYTPSPSSCISMMVWFSCGPPTHLLCG